MKHQPKTNRLGYFINLGLAAIAGLSGCFSIVGVIGALLVGLLIDTQLGTRPLFTFLVVAISVPITLWLIIRLALYVTKLIEYRQFGNPDEE